MDSLRSGHLSVMRLFLCGRRGPSHPVVESYTFVFEETDRNASVVRLAEADRTFYTDDLQSSFKNGITSLLMSIRDLARLPNHARNMWISLQFKESPSPCPRPTGFGVGPRKLSAVQTDETDALHTARLEIGRTKVSINIQRHTGKAEEDYTLSRHLGGLLRTSSRPTDLPATLPSVSGGVRRKRAATELGMVQREWGRHCIPGPVRSVPDDSHEEGIANHFPTKRRCKRSIKLVPKECPSALAANTASTKSIQT